jgi:hypothetical protein
MTEQPPAPGVRQPADGGSIGPARSCPPALGPRGVGLGLATF